jgi:hypothetical protein
MHFFMADTFFPFFPRFSLEINEKRGKNGEKTGKISVFFPRFFPVFHWKSMKNGEKTGKNVSATIIY